MATETSRNLGTGFSVLGIAWNPVEDCFYFNIKLESLAGAVTKRLVLSKIGKLFDPFGWIAPVIVTSKIFMQSLWALTKEWDTKFPHDYENNWKQWYGSLSSITKIRVPRWIGIQAPAQSFELHGFADASKLAYVAVVYLSVLDKGSPISFRGANTKVAPLKTLSIPRLELCAAQLLAKLVRHFVDNFEYGKPTVYLWSDSKDVLYWLRDIPAKWPTFIANMCSNISTLLPDAY